VPGLHGQNELLGGLQEGAPRAAPGGRRRGLVSKALLHHLGSGLMKGFVELVHGLEMARRLPGTRDLGAEPLTELALVLPAEGLRSGVGQP